jgi:hypothetical protein
MSRHAYLIGSVMLAGMAVGCCNVPCPPENNAGHACACDNSSNRCDSCAPKVVNGWVVDGGRQRQACDGCCSVKSSGCPASCPSCSAAKGQTASMPQSPPATSSADNRSGFATDQLSRPEAIPTARPRELPEPPADATQSPLPPLVPTRPAVELPPVPPQPNPPQKITANKLLPPLPIGLSSKPTTPYGQVRYSPD